VAVVGPPSSPSMIEEDPVSEKDSNKDGDAAEKLKNGEFI